ncbi:hypothetical protein M378DRAFT_919052 [Amanita muscaria Koide BX008]|uniref:BTB domain-containing protein n=1 Tax=Amanita muscaria (strain Koide BX008) TaxID=946122 RepID=A0A0C2T215_AMAMK|nr:hypothetical protein M378DRAFT_919052 [Amanita muscaria Koide BX008]
MANIEFRRHQRFWFSDGSFHLLVEKTLYRVHRYLFEMHAKNFPGITNASQDTDLALSSQTPYILDGVKQVDLDHLLAYLYPCDLVIEEAKTLAEWVSILTLALKWGFESLKAKAINKVAERASPIEKVVLGQQHDIPELLLPGYAALCQSSIPLSREEGARLGLDAVLNIYRVRQELWGTDIRPISTDEALEKVKLCIAISPSAVTQTTSPRQLPTPSGVPSSPFFDTIGKPSIPDTIEKPPIFDAREKSDSGQSDPTGSTETSIIGATTQLYQGDLKFKPTAPLDFSSGFGASTVQGQLPDASSIDRELSESDIRELSDIFGISDESKTLGS